MQVQSKHIYIILFILSAGFQDAWATVLSNHKDFLEFVFNDLGGKAIKTSVSTWTFEIDQEKLTPKVSSVKDFFEQCKLDDPLFPSESDVRAAFANLESEGGYNIRRRIQ